MRLKFRNVGHIAEVEDLPVNYDWGDESAPDEMTAEEAKMILLFEIADALKTMAYGTR